MIVLDDHGPGSIVTVNPRRIVPAETVRIQEISVRIEMHQVALAVVVASVRAIKNGSIRRNCGRRRRAVDHCAIARPIRRGIHSELRACAATSRRTVRRQPSARGYRHTAAIVQPVAQGSGPLFCQVRIDRH